MHLPWHGVAGHALCRKQQVCGSRCKRAHSALWTTRSLPVAPGSVSGRGNRNYPLSCMGSLVFLWIANDPPVHPPLHPPVHPPVDWVFPTRVLKWARPVVFGVQFRAPDCRKKRGLYRIWEGRRVGKKNLISKKCHSVKCRPYLLARPVVLHLARRRGTWIEAKR